MVHPAARPTFIKELLRHHAAHLDDVDDAMASRCRQVASASLASWGESLVPPKWDLDALQQAHPASAAAVYTAPDVWSLVAVDDQNRLLSRCLDESTVPSNPTLAGELARRIQLLSEEGLLTENQESWFQEGLANKPAWFLLAARLPARRVFPIMVDLLDHGLFDKNKEGIQLLRAADKASLRDLGDDDLSRLGRALGGAAARNAWVALGMMEDELTTEEEWPSSLRSGAFAGAVYHYSLLDHERAALAAVRIALADPSGQVARDGLALLPDLAHKDVWIRADAHELIAKVRTMIQEAGVSSASEEISELLHAAEEVHARIYDVAEGEPKADLA